MPRTLATVALLLLAACATARRAPSAAPAEPRPAPAAAPSAGPAPRGDGPGACAACEGDAAAPSATPPAMTPAESLAIERRIGALKGRGGECAQVGSVLERSYRQGQIRILPYMWRVGAHLASGEARPNGDIALAREIDSLNVGRRTLDEVLETVEHEAVHIAFAITADNGGEARVNAYVRACRETTVGTR